jgi:integrase/recombinase XerC/integrase/recombinase XerD
VKKVKRTVGLWVTEGGFYYTRKWQNDRARWVALGNDFKAAKEKLALIQAGKRRVFTRVPFEQAVSEWLSTAVATSRGAKQQRLAKVRADRYLLKFKDPKTGDTFVGRLLEEVEPDTVRRYKLWLEKQAPRAGSKGRVLSANTVTHVLADLRAFLNWCVETKRLDRSPFPRKRIMPRKQETLPKGHSEEEVATLTALPEPAGFVLRFLFGTGLRWAEGCRARADHVKGGVIEVAHTKSGKVRRVELPKGLLGEMRSRVGLLVPYSETNPGGFARMVRRASGVKDFHPHRCRHTYAMRWLAAGGSLAALQELLGHADLSTTMRYAKATQSLVRDEAKRVFEKLEGA